MCENTDLAHYEKWISCLNIHPLPLAKKVRLTETKSDEKDPASMN